MIIVFSPLIHEEIQHMLEGLEEPNFRFIKKEGIRLYFETDMADKEKAAEIAEKVIKGSQYGSIILFVVRTSEYRIE